MRTKLDIHALVDGKIIWLQRTLKLVSLLLETQADTTLMFAEAWQEGFAAGAEMTRT
jgi:hypothetical protein